MLNQVTRVGPNPVWPVSLEETPGMHVPAKAM